MAKWGDVDIRELKELQRKFKKLEEKSADEFFRSCAKELAARFLKKVIQMTPKGVYPKDSGKEGGTLIRGWTGGVESNAGSFVNRVQVFKLGSNYMITIRNAVEYASYVEFGHRTVDHRSWVPGKYMMTISEEEIEQISPKLLEKRMEKFLKGAFE